MKRILSVWLVCAVLSPAFASAESRTNRAAAKDTADSRVIDAKVSQVEAALATLKSEADSLKKKDDDRQVASELKLRALATSSATLNAEVEKLKKDDSPWLKIGLPIITVLIAGAALALSCWQLYKSVPRTKGRAIFDWPRDRSSQPLGLPRPDFHLALRNETNSEVKLTKVVFHLKSAAGEKSDVHDEYAEKLLVIPARLGDKWKIPTLKILDVVSVEAHSPTKVWSLEWNRRDTRRRAAFESIETEFFFNEPDRDEMVLDVFQAGEKFYVRKAGYSPSIYDYGFVEEHETKAAALEQFEDIRRDEIKYLVANSNNFCKVSRAGNYFRDYW